MTESLERNMKKNNLLLISEWKGLTADQKQVYVDKSAADRERYEREKAEYDAKHKK